MQKDCFFMKKKKLHFRNNWNMEIIDIEGLFKGLALLWCKDVDMIIVHKSNRYIDVSIVNNDHVGPIW